MDEAQSEWLQQQILEASDGFEIWETVKTYKLYLQDTDGESHAVYLEVRRFGGKSWSLFARNEQGEERMLTNLESSPESMCQFAHWEKLRRAPFM